MKIALPRAISPLGTRVTRAYDVALGKELFAGPAVPRALCREFPLGTSCAESKELSAERKHLSAEPAIPIAKAIAFTKVMKHKNKIKQCDWSSLSIMVFAVVCSHLVDLLL
jgi:hypothetical protein